MNNLVKLVVTAIPAAAGTKIVDSITPRQPGANPTPARLAVVAAGAVAVDIVTPRVYRWIESRQR